MATNHPGHVLDLGRIQSGVKNKFQSANFGRHKKKPLDDVHPSRKHLSVLVAIVNYGIVHSFSLESRACCITASSYSCPREDVDVGSGREQAVTMVSLVVVEAEVSLQLVVVVVPGIGLRFSIGLPMLAAFCLPFLMKKTKIFRKRFLSKLVCKNKIKCEKFHFLQTTQ